MGPHKTLSNRFSSLSGLNIVLGKRSVIKIDKISIFDMLQGVWGIGLMCFSVVLFKLTKYINRKVKDETLGRECAKFRENLCILLSKNIYLKRGRYSNEMVRARYYLKEELMHD